MRIALPSLIFFWESRLPAKFDNDMKTRMRIALPSLIILEKAGCLPYSIMMWNKDADCPTILDFLEKAGCLPYLIMICNKDADCPTLLDFFGESRLPAIFDNDMKQGCGLPYPPWFFFEKAGCLPNLIMIWKQGCGLPYPPWLFWRKQVACHIR